MISVKPALRPGIVFRAKRSDRIKLVWWDGTGLTSATTFAVGAALPLAMVVLLPGLLLVAGVALGDNGRLDPVGLTGGAIDLTRAPFAFSQLWPEWCRLL